MLRILLIILFCFPCLLFSQNKSKDSLWSDFNNSTLVDSVRFNALKQHVRITMSTDMTGIEASIDSLFSFSERSGNEKWIGDANKTKGTYFFFTQDLLQAINYYHESLSHFETAGDLKSQADVWSNIGAVHGQLSDTKSSTKALLNSIDLFNTNNQGNEAYLPYGNLAINYLTDQDYLKSYDTYLKLFELDLPEENRAVSLSNYGFLILTVYMENDTAFAEKYFGINQESTKFPVLWKSLVDSCQSYQEKSLNIFRKLKMEDSYNFLLPNLNLAKCLLIRGDLKKAKKYYLKVAKKAEHYGSLSDKVNSYEGLAQVFEKLEMYDSALYYNELIDDEASILYDNEIKESIASIESKLKGENELKILEEKAVAKQNLTKEKQAIELKYEERQANRKQNIILGLIAALLVLIGLSVMFYNRRKSIQKQNHLIQKQKIGLEDANKVIDDNILAAKEIQINIFKDSKDILKSLKANLFFKPKEAVGGDFYFAKKLSEGKTFVALCDCTGHGVAGGLTTVIMKRLLSESIVESNPMDGLNKTMEVLNSKMHDFLLQHDEIKTGMDCAFLVIDKPNQTFEFIGAGINLFVIKEGNVEEFKSERLSLGRFEKVEYRNSELKTFLLNFDSIDCCYITTDGYLDQKGDNNEKYMRFRFRKFLENLNENSWNSHVEVLANEMHQWKGSMEQIDDISVLGINPKLI